MTRERSDLDVGTSLGAWMNDAAPASVPVVVLEEAFARTMSSRQVRVYPWQRLAGRGPRPKTQARLALVATAGLVVTILALGMLGGGFGIAPTATPTPTPTPTPTVTATSSPSASATPSHPAVVPVPIVPTATIAISKVQGLATDGTAVWSLTETGLVQRIDLTTNRAGPGTQTGAITDLYNDISADKNGVWVTDWDSASLYRLDPATSKVVAVIPAGLAPKGIVTTGTAVWVADTHDGKLLRIDPATNKVVATVVVGPSGNSGPNWLASGVGSIWVGIPNNHTVVRVDAVTNAIQATIPISAEATPCGGFAVTATAVWNLGCDGSPTMTRIDPATNAAVAMVKPDGQAYEPAVIGGSPWVSIDTSGVGAGHLGRISAATDTVDLELAPGPSFGGGGDLVVAAGSAWVIDGGNDRVLRLPLAGFPPG